MTQDKAPEWAIREANDALNGTMAHGSPLFISRVALALSQAYERGQESMRERAARKAEGISLNPPETWVVRVGEDYAYTLGAQECSRAIRSLPIEQEGGE